MPHRPLVKSRLLFHTMTATLYGRQQRRVVSVNKYKHCCSAEMASPWFNYRSCQSKWKNTAPDKAQPHSLILHRPFSHLEMHRHPSANSQIKTLRWRHSFAPNTQVTLQCRVAVRLWHLRNGVYSTSTIARVFFSQAWGICTTTAAASSMNNISGMWLCSYLSQWLQFTFQLLQGAFIWCLNSTGDSWLLQDAWARRNEVDTERGWIAPPDLYYKSSAQGHYGVGVRRPGGHSTRGSSHESHFREETHVCYFQRS